MRIGNRTAKKNLQCHAPTNLRLTQEVRLALQLDWERNLMYSNLKHTVAAVTRVQSTLANEEA